MKVEQLILQSKNFSQQFHFYVETLGLDLVEKKDDFFSIKVGSSILVFKKSLDQCYYHFAFNIPPFRIMKALDWVQKRASLLKYKGENIVDFPNWNAKAFYFFDADQNIVEFIDRRNLDVKTDEDFSNKKLLELSEVGLPVNNIRQAFQKLNLQAAINQYSGDLENFCAAGDEHGLFIIVDQKSKNWLPTNLPAKAFPFELYFSNDHEKYFLKYDGIEIAVRKG